MADPNHRRWAALIAPVLVTVLVTIMLIARPTMVVTAAGPCLRPPVEAPIAERFREPGCPWCPGHRGLEFAVAPGTPVRAAAAGRVTFAGVVAGTRYVVVEHADGLRATYGRLVGSHLVAADVVAAGALIGRSDASFYFGLRRGSTYLDPEPLLGRLVGRARLVPTDGTPARPAPPARLRCPGGGAGERSR